MTTTRHLLSITLLALLGLQSNAADKKPDSITVATWNVEWFFDNYLGDNSSDLSKEQSAPSRAEWDWKLDKVAAVIGNMKPTILALQEVENRQVIRQLTRKLADKHGLKYRIAYIEGWDNFTEQDVAIIYRSGLVQYSCREQSYEMFNSRNYYNLNKHLFAQFEWGSGQDLEKLTILNVHLRATPEKHVLREKQCQLAHYWLKEKISSGENVIALGDFNTEETSESVKPNSDLAILSGWQSNDNSDDLFDLHRFLPKEARGTHLTGRQFDRILVSQPLLSDHPQTSDLVFSGIKSYRNLVVNGDQDKNHFNMFYKIPREQRDVSDHYPVMAEFKFN